MGSNPTGLSRTTRRGVLGAAGTSAGALAGCASRDQSATATDQATTAATTATETVDETAEPTVTDERAPTTPGLQRTLNDGRIAIVADRDPIGSIDPADHERPVQAAIDAIDAVRDTEPRYGQGGVVHLPPGTVEEAGTIELSTRVTLQGQGNGTTEINFTNRDAPGVDMTVASSSGIFDLTINGPGKDQETGPAIYTGWPGPYDERPEDYDRNTNAKDFTIDNIGITGWANALMRFNAITWACRIGEIRQAKGDAGADRHRALFEFNRFGFSQVDFIHCYPGADHSGQNTNVVFVGEASAVVIGRLNIGGTAGRALWHENIRYGASGPVILHTMNYEARRLPEDPPPAPIKLDNGPRQDVIGSFQHHGVAQNPYAIEINGASRDFLHRPHTGDAGDPFEENVVLVTDEYEGPDPSYYFGTADEVDNESGGATNIRALGEGPTVE